MAPLQVGSAYAEFFLKTSGLEEGVNTSKQLLAQLGTTAQASTKQAQAISAANKKIVDSMKALQQQLSALKPFDELSKNARDAYIAVVGNSYIPDLREESVAEIDQLRQQLKNAKPFDPLSQAAADAADKTEAELEQLRERAASIQAKIENIGISREQLRGVIDNEGRVRDSLLRRDAGLAATRNTDQFDRVVDTDAQTRRFEEIQLAAEPGTRAAMTDDIEALKELAANARDAYNELSSVESKIKSIETDPERPKRDPVASAKRDAIAALEAYDEATTRVNTSLAEMQRLEDRAGTLSDRYRALKAAKEGAAEGSERHFKAAYLTVQAEQQLEALMQRYDQTAAAASAAEDDHAAALRRVIAAQQDLTAAEREAATTRPRRSAQSSSTAASPSTQPSSPSASRETGPTKAEQLEEIRAQRQAEKIAAEERIANLRAQTAEKDRQTALELERERQIGEMKRSQAQADATRYAADQQRLSQREAAEQRIAFMKERDARNEDRRQKSQQTQQNSRRDRELRAEAQEQIRLTLATRDYASALEQVQQLQQQATGADRIRLQRQEIEIRRRQQRDEEPELPRRFAGFAGQGLLEIAGAFGLATTAAEAFNQAYNAIAEGDRLRGRMDETRRSLGALISSVDRGNRIFDEAAEFGDKYRFTNEEMTKALEALAPQIRNSTLAAEQQLEITARLLSRAPGQGFDGAAFSIGELANLDPVSITERFNVPREAARRMKEEIAAGADVFQVLDRELNRLGVTAAILEERLDGPAGASRDLAKASEDLKIALAGLFEDDITAGKSWAAETQRSMAKGLDALKFLREQGSLSDFIPTLEQASQFKPSAASAGNPLAAFIEQTGAILAIGTENAAARVKDAQVEIDPALKAIGDQATVLSNKLGEGKINLSQYAEALSKIGEARPAADSFGLVSGTEYLPDPERIERLQTVLAAFQRQIGERPEIASNLIPQMQAIAAELDRLKAKAPVVITIQMRQQFLSQAAGIMEQTASRAAQVNEQLGSLDEQYSKRQGDLARQAADSWSTYLQQRNRAAAAFSIQQARAARDFAQQQARSARDFAQQERKAEADHARQVADIRQKLADQLAKIEQDKQKRLRDLQRDFDVDQTRSREDFDEERLKLLAEGRIFEAQELAREYEKEQRRKAEDLSRNRSDTVDQAGAQSSEATTNASQQIANEAAQFARQRAERRAAYEQQRADAAAAYAQQRADAAAAFAQQQAEAAQAARQQQAAIAAQQATERKTYTDSRTKLLKDFDQYLIEQRTKLEQAQQNIIEAQRRGVDLALVEQEKSLERSKQTLSTNLNKLGIELGQAGTKAATAYMREFAAALTFGANTVDNALKGTEDRLRPRSPIRRGPLKDLESAGRRAGDQYMLGLHRGLNGAQVDPALAEIRDRLQIETSAASRSTNPSRATGDSGSASSRQAIQIVIAVDGPTLDGEKIAAQLASKTTELFTDALSIEVQVTDASNTPTLQQAAFRTI